MTPHSKRSVSEEQLLVNAMDLFSAGSETTATTLAWAVRGMFSCSCLVLKIPCLGGGRNMFSFFGRNSMSWCSHITPSQVNYMLLHPEVQTKVQEEVDQVLGDRAPSLADRGR